MAEPVFSDLTPMQDKHTILLYMLYHTVCSLQKSLSATFAEKATISKSLAKSAVNSAC